MKHKFISILLTLVLALSLCLVTAVPVAAQENTWYVATTGSDAFGDGSETWVDVDEGGVWSAEDTGPWLTITHAISQASDTDTINVAAGTYNEHVVIDKQLTLLGANADVNPVKEERGDESIIDGTGLAPVPPTTPGGLVYISGAADDIVFKGFTVIESPYKSGGIDIAPGSDKGVYENNIVSDNENTAFFILGDGNVIRNNVISDNRHWGEIGQINLQMYTDDNIIENNAISGGGKIQIMLWNAFNGNIVQNNTITGVGLVSAPPYPIGILLSDVGIGNIVRENTINPEEGGVGFDRAINIAGARFGGLNTLVEYNIIHNNVVGVKVGTEMDTTLVKGNDIHENEYGIKVEITAKNTTIEENDILGNDVGIIIPTGSEPIAASTTHINQNNIADNTIGVLNEILTPVDATLNWWGDADPSDDVSANVDFMPWYATETTTPKRQNVTVKVGDTVDVRAYSDTIQGGIDAALAGDTVNVAAGIYDETVKLKSTTASGISVLGENKATTFITEGIGFAADYSGLKVQHFTISGNGFIGTETYEATVSNVWPGHRVITDLEFSDCIFDGEGYDDGEGGRCGIVIKRLGGVVKFVNNDFKNYPGWATLDVNDGSGGALTVTSYTLVGNDFLDNGGGCALRGNPGDYTDTVIVTGNTFDGPAGWAAIEVNRADNVEIYDNEIRNVEEYLDWGEGQAIQLWQVGTVEIYKNTIENNYQGIAILNYPDPYDISNISIYHNSFSVNAKYALSVDNGLIGGPLDAKKNWWGNASGPDGAQVIGDPGTYIGVLPGTGNKVSANVKCMPWLTRPFEKVLEDNIAYFGISFPVEKGWNIVSTPLALDAHVDVDGLFKANTWDGLLNLGKKEGDKYALKIHDTSPIYYYVSDPSLPPAEFGWQTVDKLTEINPVDAYYVRMKESDSIPILFSPDFSVPSKKLYQGWNLVGCAYMDVMFEEAGEQPPVETALATITTVSSPVGDVKGYSQVVSPPINQPPWIFIPPPPMNGTLIPSGADSTILMGKGYWVFMENPGTLAGLTFTPISLPKP